MEEIRGSSSPGRGWEPLKEDPEAARSHLARICRRKSDRQRVLAFLARSVERAIGLDNSRWGFTLHKDYARLNLGRIEVLTLTRDVVHVVLDGDSMLRAHPEEAAEERLDRGSGSLYSSVPGSASFDFEWSESEDLLPRVLEAHLRLLQSAAATPIHPRTRTGHSPAAVIALGTLTGIELVQPNYVGR